jgi:hypothetical protein
LVAEPPPACGTTNGEYAQAPPLDCPGTGGGTISSIALGAGTEVIDTIDRSSGDATA